ncbi:PIG-L family deacetylase, partial [Candidatus Poribacteria bacterium]|nr:PIG-L family deacetylase [Candidatus Poribacteria bacterium]
DMEVMDFPDSGLKEMDVRILEQAVKNHIEKLKPHIVATYPVHGISGFHDHLVTHAVVKRVYLEIRDAGTEFPKRLAFWTMPDSDEPTSKPGELPRLKLTEEDLIDCIFPLDEDDIKAMKESLKCYASYQEVIKKIDPVEQIGDKAHFEIFGENFDPVLDDLTKEM